MGLSEKLLELRWRAAGHLTRPLPAAFSEVLAGARGLEIGGPSAVFSSAGLLRAYPLLTSLDGVQWAAETAWHTLDRAEGYRPEGRRLGELHVIDSVDLPTLPERSYDAVLSSHVLEHIANPLRALAAWRRVSRPDGHLLLVAPHMEGTFDHRRAPTTLDHMIEDFERGVEEDDLTHLEETLRLHDRERDTEPFDATWEQRRRANVQTRLLHHHTFTTPSLLELLDYAGLELLAAETRFPHDIYVLGRWSPEQGSRAANAAFMSAPRASPFRADRHRTGRRRLTALDSSDA